MEDVTDPAFRLMCKGFGADMVYTEFVSSDALIRSVSKTEQKLNISDEERPVAIQIYGKDTDTMVEAARIVEQARPGHTGHQFRLPRKTCGRQRSRCGNVAEYPQDAGDNPCRGRCRKDTRDRKNPSRLGCRQQDYRRFGRTTAGLRHCRPLPFTAAPAPKCIRVRRTGH